MLEEKKYIVKVTNKILGNSKHIMTKKEIKKFNLCAYMLSDLVDIDNKKHSTGMWSVENYNNKI